MDLAVAVAGFLGAWLLVAGPVHQASVEAGQERFDRVGLAAVQREVPRPAPLSPWWWLLPPLSRLVHLRRRHGAYRSAVHAALPEPQLTHHLALKDEAVGWLLVGAGAVLIGVKETGVLVGALDLPSWVLPVVVVVALVLSCGFTVARQLGWAAGGTRRQATAGTVRS